MKRTRAIADGELTDKERAGYTETLRLVERYVAEAPQFQIILPRLTVEDRMTLHRGNRVIEIRLLGRAHTAADQVVHLPKENIAVTGDLGVLPVPLIGSTSYPAEYWATLEKLLPLRPAVIVPGHGPVMRDDMYVKLMVRLLTSIKQQVAAAVGRGEPLEQTRKSVNLTESSQAFAGDSKIKSFVARQSDFERGTMNSLSRRRRNRVSRAHFLGHDAGSSGLAIVFLAIQGLLNSGNWTKSVSSSN